MAEPRPILLTEAGFQASTIKVTPPDKSRKRQARPETWKSAKAKKIRYSPQDLPTFPTCGHNGKTFRCSKLCMNDINRFHGAFYKTANKVEQDNFILKHITAKTPRDVRRTHGGSRKGVSVSYFIKKAGAEKFCVQVCQKAFLGTLQVSKNRVQRIAKNYNENGSMPKENRGGDRKSKKQEPKKLSVIRYISSLRGIESHYCRDNASTRQYLSSDLNIKKLWRMYQTQAEVDLKVKDSYFRSVFVNHFNIGFGAPVTDACSKCIELTEKIKFEKDASVKSDLIIEKRVHKLRANAYFDQLREVKEGMVTMSFDCEKNNVNPKIPDQAAYYSRQIYTYNFGVVQGSSHSKLNKDTVFLYTWTELERFKGSNEIASAVYHRLLNSDLDGVEIIRLCADGCGGQNKNSTMIGMCMFWLANKAPRSVKSLELVFPVSGHSFIPPDRVFGNIERVIKKKPTITDPKEYLEIFKNHGTVIELGQNNFVVQDWKKEVSEVVKLPGQWHFKISATKRVIITRPKSKVLVRGEPNYRTDIGQAMSIFKKGKNINLMSPQDLPSGVPIKPAKLKDVDNLLTKHFGANWKDLGGLSFYKDAMNHNETIEINNAHENDEDDLRDINVDDGGLTV